MRATANAVATSRLPAVDAYIERAQPFAQPILRHLRAVLHEAVPECEEAMKWSRPFFLQRGIILGNIAGFKQHCSFGLWGERAAAAVREAGASRSSEGMGTFGEIRSLDDLPPRDELLRLVREAARHIDEGTRTRSFDRAPRVARPAADMVPPALQHALDRDSAAAAAFARMTPSCRREYNQWIAEAKKDETRARRAEQAVAMIAEGKGRNWRYEARHATAQVEALTLSADD